jgi:sulfur carrier protein
MDVQLNGQPHRLDTEQTLGQLVDWLELRRDGIAVAVNGDVIPRSSYDDKLLQSGDRIEIIQAVGGG